MPDPSTSRLVSLSNHRTDPSTPTRTSFLEYLSPQRKAEHSLDRLDSFDLQTADHASDVEMARRVVGPAEEAYPPARRLFQDALLGLYKAVPQQKAAEQVTPSHRLNHHVMGKAMQERAFEELRLRTKLDPAMAMLGAVNLWEQLMQLLTEEQKEAARRAAQQEEKAAQKEQQAETAEALAEAAAQAGDEQKAGQFQKQAARLQEQAQKARQKAETAMQAALQDAPSDQAIHRAVKQAAEKTDEQAESVDGWGLDPGALQGVAPEERLALAERVTQSDKLRRLAALVGRFRNLAIAARYPHQLFANSVRDMGFCSPL
jgi:hypothetical protein